METKFEVKYKKDIVNNHLRINGSLVEFSRKNGIVEGRNYSTGCGHSAHANIDASGSVTGMKKLGYWGKDDKIVRAHGAYYNMSTVVVSDAIDAICLLMEQGKFDAEFFADADQWVEKTKVIELD